MKILLLGGRVFLGRHVVDAARARGHDVTLFNRGKSNPDLFGDLEQLVGDRDGGLDALRGRRWDAVVDTCGYVPRIVGDSASLLADAVEHYTFVSSISVYPEIAAVVDEDSPVDTLEDESIEEITGETYGPLKALCERAAERAMPGRVLHVRAGLIVGPHDPTDRFTYWPARLAEGGRVLAPGREGAKVQFVDGRDLADWIVACAEGRVAGVFNATGPEEPLTMRDFLTRTVAALESGASLVWASDEFLTAQSVGPWMELPLWIPGGDLEADCTRTFGAGLRCRPLAETVRDTAAWSATRPADRAWRAGLSRERERELIAAHDAAS